ncbi:MAG: ABC transporter permease, partial [Lentisphaeria bacterium]|nr:ABC transporter permease [Lentisphaeria bacterium]
MILSIYHEIVKMASQKKHYIMLIGYAFLMTLMVFVYWKFQNRFLGEAERMLQGMPYIMQKMIPDPSKLCDGLMFARFSCMILFWVVMPIFAFMFAGEAIACEQQDGTLRAYLSRGFSRTQFAISKFIAVFLVILFYSMLFAALTMLIGIVFFGFSKMQITLFMSSVGEFPPPGLVSAKKAILSYYLATLYS